MAGSVWFGWRKGHAGAKILTNVFHVRSRSSTNHAWRIYASDAFDADAVEIPGEDCDFLQTIFDTHSKNGDGCSEKAPQKCLAGDLTGKFGKVLVGKRQGPFTKKYFEDDHLNLTDLKARALYLVIYDEDHPDSFLTCARLRGVGAKTAAATFGSKGITGEIRYGIIMRQLPVIITN